MSLKDSIRDVLFERNAVSKETRYEKRTCNEIIIIPRSFDTRTVIGVHDTLDVCARYRVPQVAPALFAAVLRRFRRIVAKYRVTPKMCPFANNRGRWGMGGGSVPRERLYGVRVAIYTYPGHYADKS